MEPGSLPLITSPQPSTSSAAALAAPSANNRPLFEDSEKIYEDENVLFSVQKKQLLRQKKFSLDTFRYKVTAERKIPISGSDPEQGPKYLVDFSSAIEMTIAKLFGSLSDYYKKNPGDFDHQVYVTLMAPGLNGLNVGNFGLEDSDPQKVARLCTTYLYNILNSDRVVNMHVGLEGFEIDMKVSKAFFVLKKMRLSLIQT